MTATCPQPDEEHGEAAAVEPGTNVGFTLDELDVFGPLDSLPYPLGSDYWKRGVLETPGPRPAENCTTYGSGC
jgi:hypothetical protein